MKYKSIDLFAGIGGIRLGFDKAFGENIETVFVSEWDEKAQEKGEDKPKKVFDHACDSDRYGLYTHNKNNASGIYRIRRL